MIHDSNTLNTIKRLAWVTDIHLDFLGNDQIKVFCDQLKEPRHDAILIGGDIADATSISSYLLQLADELACPIYFVLGNHDYYFSSITAVRKEIETLCQQSQLLNWLPATGAIRLTDQSCLIGHGSWADGRLGNYLNSTVLLSDYVHIQELAGLDNYTRLSILNKLGDQAATFLCKQLRQALNQYQHVLLLTHVPPFKEACWYQGKIADDNWLPHFSCKAVGKVLLDLMQQHPDHTMTVLCGHTHNSGVVQMLPNLLVRTGQAEYGSPELQDVILVN